MILGLLDPDPSVRCADPDRILISSSKNSKKNLVSYCFVMVLFLDFLSLKNDVNVPAKNTVKENIFFKLPVVFSFVGVLKVNDEK
jgi:hypothetical protein